MNVIKDAIAFIIIPLTYIIDPSLANGVVPDQLKIARVIPLFKSGTISLFTNYRPVFVLPALSKILERIVYKRLMGFLDTYMVSFLVANTAFEKIILQHMPGAYARIRLHD